MIWKSIFQSRVQHMLRNLKFQETYLHLERSNGGVVKVYQRGCSSGEYDLAYTAVLDKIIDCDFGALVYPKYIKVVSGSEVVKGAVTFG